MGACCSSTLRQGQAGSFDARGLPPTALAQESGSPSKIAVTNAAVSPEDVKVVQVKEPPAETVATPKAGKPSFFGFKRGTKAAPDVAKPKPKPPKPPPSLTASTIKSAPGGTGDIRVLQWNILADGLSEDGFLVKDELPDLPSNAPAFKDLVEQVRRVRESNDLSRMQALKTTFDSERSRHNHHAVVAWERRWAQMRDFIDAARPHIITMQEVDHIADMQQELRSLGYECALPDKEYKPAHEWADSATETKDPLRFYEHLDGNGVAFIPKTTSNCRKYGIHRGGRADADDDGVAIFWRTDALKVEKLEFLVMFDKKRNQGAVRATLSRVEDGAQLVIICAHLSSGTKREDEEVRMKELSQASFNREGKLEGPSLCEWFEEAAKKAPTLLCLDANTRPDQAEATDEGTTVWKTLRSDPKRGQLMRSVWDGLFDANGALVTGQMPSTTNKMRGPLSEQPKKIGEHTFGVVDHIFYSRTISMEQHAWGPCTYETEDEALQDLLPSMQVPSDHVPLLVDLRLPLVSERTQLLLDACDAYRSPTDVGMVRQLLNEGGEAIVNATDAEGRTALCLAARSGSEFVVDLLLEKGADRNKSDKTGRTPYIWAALEGHVRVMDKLSKESSVRMTKDESGWTAGMLAAAQYRFKAAETAGFNMRATFYGMMRDANSSHTEEMHQIVESQQESLRGAALKERREKLAGGPLVRLVFYGWHTFEFAFLATQAGTRAERTAHDRSAVGTLYLPDGRRVGKAIPMPGGRPFRDRMRFDEPGVWIDRQNARGGQLELHFVEEKLVEAAEDKSVRAGTPATAAAAAPAPALAAAAAVPATDYTPVQLRFKRPSAYANAGGGVGLRLYAVLEGGEALCGTVTRVTREGLFDIRIDNGGMKTELVPYKFQRLRVAESKKHEVGTKLMVVQPDNTMVDAEVVAWSGGKELGNQHTLRLRGKAVPYDLNEYNSTAALRFTSVDAYNEARVAYLKHVVTEGQMVEDAITGKKQNIEKQLLFIEIDSGSDKAGGGVKLPGLEAVKKVTDFAPLLLKPAPRATGGHSTQPVLMRADPGTGKSWSTLQLHHHVAKMQLDAGPSSFVPMLLRIQRLVHFLKKPGGAVKASDNLLLAYMEHEYGGTPHFDVLKQAYDMRLLVALIDGIDEAAGMKEQIEDFIIYDLVPMGIQVLVTSRPEGVRLYLYQEEWVIVNLAKLTDEQARNAVNAQLGNNPFFDNATRFAKIRKDQEANWLKAFPQTSERNEIEILRVDNRLVIEEASGKLMPSAEGRQQIADNGTTRNVKAVPKGQKPRSQLLQKLDGQLRGERKIISALEKVLSKRDSRTTAVEIEAAITQGIKMDGDDDMLRRVVMRLGLLSYSERKEGRSGAVDDLWSQIVASCDELYVATEAVAVVFGDTMRAAVARVHAAPPASAGDQGTNAAAAANPAGDAPAAAPAADAPASAPVAYSSTDLSQSSIDLTLSTTLKDPVRVFEKAASDYRGDTALVLDVLRARAVANKGSDMLTLLTKLAEGTTTFNLPAGEVKLTLLRAKNKCSPKMLDPTRLRNVLCNLRLEFKGYASIVELQVHHEVIFGYNESADAHTPYEFFRRILKGSYGEELNGTLERTLLFLEEASGIPVMLSMLVLVFEEHSSAAQRGEEAQLPSCRLELYVQATRAVLAKLYPEDTAKQVLTLNMLQRVAVATMIAERREFDSGDVAEALGGRKDEIELWAELEGRQALPLIKVLAEASGGAAAQFQFKHLSFAEGLFSQHLIDTAKDWDGWRTDASACKFLNNPFYENPCRIGAEQLGGALAKARDVWDLKTAYIPKVGGKLNFLYPGAMPHLKILRVKDDSSCRANEQSAKAAALSHTLQELDVKMDEKATLAFMEAVQHNEVLTSLSLVSVSMEDKSASLLAKWLCGKSALTCLSVGRAASRMATVGPALAENTRIHTLKLRNAYLSSTHMKDFANALIKNRGITELDLAKNGSVDVNGWSELAKAMRGNATLRMLDVSECNLTAEHGKTFAEGLQDKCALEVLLMGDNMKLGDAGCVAILMKLQGRKVPMRQLDLSTTNLGDDGCAKLISALRGAKWGTKLHVGGNGQIGGASATALAALLSTSPPDATSLFGGAASLRVKGEEATAPFATLLAGELARGALHALTIDAEELNDKAADALSDALSDAHELQTLVAPKKLVRSKPALTKSPCATNGGMVLSCRAEFEGATPYHTRQYGHPQCFSADGKRLFGAAGGNAICVWVVQTGALLMKLEGHTNSVRAICLSNDGARLFSIAGDNTVRVWDTEQGSCEMVLEDHKDEILCVCEGIHGERIYSGGGAVAGGDCAIRMWDARQGSVVLKFEGHKDRVLSLLCTPDGKHLLSGSRDTTIRVWDLKSGTCTRVLEDHRTFAVHMIMSCGGTRLFSIGLQEGPLVWDWPSDGTGAGTVLRTCDMPPPILGGFYGHWDMVATADGERIICLQECGSTARFYIFKTADGTCELELFLPWACQKLLLTPDDRSLYAIPCSSGKPVVTWELPAAWRSNNRFDETSRSRNFSALRVE